MFGVDATARRLPRGLKLAAALIVTTVWLAAPTTAHAQTDYAFSNATAVLDGTPYSITGAFTVDPFNGVLFAQIDVTGSGPLAGVRQCDVSGETNLCQLRGASFQNDLLQLGPNFQIQFSGAFNSFALTSVEINGFTDNAPTGVATPNGGPLTYSFANASAVFNGDRESITGTFVFDPLNDIEYGGSAQIVLTGPAPYAGSYNFDIENNGPDAVYGFGPGGLLEIGLANDLDFSADPIRLVVLQNLLVDDAPTGFVCPGACPIATPEPTSLALVGAALGLLFLLRLPIGGVPPLSRLSGRAARDLT
jgi:hypothetical protein